jgi:hypothetical protein
MADWVTISSLATAGGTLVLAGATFASVRSANRAARVAEVSVMAGLRPLLMPSRLDDPVQKVAFMDEVFLRVDGGHGEARVTDEAVYLAISVRNAGAELPCCTAGACWTGTVPSTCATTRRRRPR